MIPDYPGGPDGITIVLQEAGGVTLEAEVGVMMAQAKEYGQPLEARKFREHSLLESSERNRALLTQCVPLTSSTVR